VTVAAPVVQPGEWPAITIIVPSFNEDPDELRLCFESLAAQDYPGRMDVHVVDDHSPNREDALPVLWEYEQRSGWRVHLPVANKGKRLAQDTAVRDSAGDLVLTIDSDTQLAPDAVRQMVLAFTDDTVGAATGNVRVSNAKENLLTRLIDLRYWVAFNQERAAHSYFWAVLCCSGPLSMYRRSVIDEVWEKYVSQTFRGIECTYGDDRHLTNLVLAGGWKTVYVPDAHCITSAPTTLQQYLKQQLRWNKSYYRELLWTLSFLPRLGRYMWFEVITQALLPMLLAVAVVATVVRSVLYGPEVLGFYALLVVVMATLHCLYAVWRMRTPKFFMFVVYGFLHALLLIPVRLRAMVSLTDNSWGTRGTPVPAQALPVAAPARVPELRPTGAIPVAAGTGEELFPVEGAPERDRQLVLVVDDDDGIRTLVSRRLKAAGFDVVTAVDGAEALAAVSAFRPNLVLLDMSMPGMSGLEVCRTIRYSEENAELPVIFLSAHGEPEDLYAGIAAGAEDYVVKPFSPRDLVRRAESVLARVG
jgi:hyaluronan synthase/N-acetylglucosaminyltransferase